jgi:GGDEF domain-containing protein
MLKAGGDGVDNCPMLITLLVSALIAAVVVALLGRRRRRALERELREQRRTGRVESLTRLRTAYAFEEDLELELMRADRNGRPATIVVLGLPSDAESGGGSRREDLASVIGAVLRGVDAGYRIGANELALILPETRAQAAVAVAQRVQQALVEAGTGDVSAGIAEAGPGIDRHELFRHAYRALLAAGRGGASVYAVELEHPPTPGDPEKSAGAGPR